MLKTLVLKLKIPKESNMIIKAGKLLLNRDCTHQEAISAIEGYALAHNIPLGSFDYEFLAKQIVKEKSGKDEITPTIVEDNENTTDTDIEENEDNEGTEDNEEEEKVDSKKEDVKTISRKRINLKKK